MNWTAAFGRLVGIDDLQTIESSSPAFGSAWAHSSPILVWIGCASLIAISCLFYSWTRQTRRGWSWMILAGLRSVLLCLLLLVLADPIVELTIVREPKPVLWLLLDGSESMSIPDKLAVNDQAALAKVSGIKEGDELISLARVEYARAFLSRNDRNFVRRLNETYRVRPFLFSENQRVRSLMANDAVDGIVLAGGWTTTGTSTAIGDALEQLSQTNSLENLAGVLIFSDFDQNVGTSPLPVARKLGVPIFTVGIGAEAAVDVSVDLRVPLTIKRAESTSIHVAVRQRELDATTVNVQLSARPRAESDPNHSNRIVIGEKTLLLDGDSVETEFAFTPDVTGTYVISAHVDVVEGEVITENNTAEREVKIIDDFLRLMYVEFEPSWEWRFIKEVLHRDRLVGLRGFRTFIRSADPTVRESNELFLPALTLPRSQFFENDVIFLGDMPADALSQRFCEMTKEFVGQFGGGLVVIAGPRFGPGQLAKTPLADLLPVIVDADTERRDGQEFALNLTPIAAQYDFMRLGHTEADNRKAWNNLAKLPWFQPVRRVETKGTRVLAEHPTDKCLDGQTPQPLIAIRQYGRGEVVFIAFNEMWRLRRLHGEEFYRQFWGQLIHRLGLSHAIGSHKRFVVRTDKSVYRTGDRLVVTVEAHDREFEPLDEQQVPGRQLQAEIVGSDGAGNTPRSLGIPQLKQGIFETSVPLTNAGEYRLRVKDPVADNIAELSFEVVNVLLERKNPVRNSALQASLASETGGRAYDLTTADQFLDDFQPDRHREQSIQVVTLWNHWYLFVTVIGLLVAEWIFRKRLNLA